MPDGPGRVGRAWTSDYRKAFDPGHGRPLRVGSPRHLTQRNPAAVASPMLFGAPFWSMA